jgi:hypothetical protein
MLKSKITFNIVRYDDGELNITPSVKNDIDVDSVIFIISILVRSLNMSIPRIIWEIIKRSRRARYENMD